MPGGDNTRRKADKMTYKLFIATKRDIAEEVAKPLYSSHWKWHAHKKQQEARPKLLKKLLRVNRQTKGKIISVQSVFESGNYIKVIKIA